MKTFLVRIGQVDLPYQERLKPPKKTQNLDVEIPSHVKSHTTKAKANLKTKI